mmetsp:Transcript_3414/g.6496  ORF Transcript_3414/g.6496 Transcript_3414/m.6496 type:complete len:222 (-) Transcript_3414:3560-4225(-)
MLLLGHSLLLRDLSNKLLVLLRLRGQEHLLLCKTFAHLSHLHSGLCQALKTRAQPIHDVVNILTIGDEQPFVVLDVIQVILGGHVIVSAQLQTIQHGLLVGHCVNMDHCVCDLVSQIVWEIKFFKEPRADSTQGLLWPLGEPVDHGVVHKPREIPTSRTESVPGRRHAQHNVQVVTAPVHEVRPLVILRGGQPQIDDLIHNRIHQTLLLIVCKQRRHHARG